MQKTTYVCDHCGKDVGKQKHFSLNFGRYSGVAVPPKPEVVHDGEDWVDHGRWTIKPRLENKFIHLHTGCVARFFAGLLKEKKK